MRGARQLLLLGAGLGLLVACGPAEESVSSSTEPPANTLTNSAPDAAVPVARTDAPQATSADTNLTVDMKRGELLSLACQACHLFAAGQGHHIGPNLNRVFGRVAGSVEGFRFSEVLEQSELVWTPEAIDAWLVDPAGYLAGNLMTFAGYRSADDRRDLIGYLIVATGGLPAAPAE